MEIVIDGDMILYRAAHASEVETKWCDSFWTLHTDEADLRQKAEESIEHIERKTGATKTIMAFSDDKTFRYDIYPEYKGNRKNKRKPMGLKDLKEWLTSKYETLIWDNLEADDVIGIYCTRNPNAIAVSGDKDFATLPITWYNHLKDETRVITPAEAKFNHLVQTLTGDSVDGFEGIKGVGPVTARKHLHKGGTSWANIVELYEAKDLTEDDALLTARLCYILQDGDYNEKTKDIKLWLPSNQDSQTLESTQSTKQEL